MKKREKWLISPLAAALLLLCLMMPVHKAEAAWDFKDGEVCSSLIGGFYTGSDGEYYYTPKQEYTVLLYHEDGSTSYKTLSSHYERSKLYLVKSNGMTQQVYCGESGVTFNNANDAYQSGDGVSSSFLKRLPEEARKGMMLASLYGWAPGKSTPVKGTNQDDFSYATQALIWEFQQGLRVSDSTGRKANGKVAANTFYETLKGRPAEQCYDWIVQQIQEHHKTPSFANADKSKAQTLRMKYSTSTRTYSLSVKDTNQINSDYTILNAPSYLTYKQNNNEYTFTSTKMITEPVTLELQRKVTGNSGNFLIWGRPGYQTIMTGMDNPVVQYMKLDTDTYGKGKVVKTSEDGKVDGFTFRIQGYETDLTATTGKEGSILFDNLLPGTYTVTELPTEAYVTPASQTIVIESGKTAEISFHNRLKKFRVSVKKSDVEREQAQGDASLAGAAYGIFKDGTLKDMYYTDASGSFVTDYYICGSGWTLKELTASEGYLVDSTVHTIGSEAKLYTVEHSTASNAVKEQVIKGRVGIVKHSDLGETGIDTPEEGAVFQIYLARNQSYDQAPDHQRDLLTTNEDGYGLSKMLPYGTYTIAQIKGKEGTESVSPFRVFIGQNEKTYYYILNNAPYNSYLQIAKKDADTKKNIAVSGIGFQIRDRSSGQLVKQEMRYPTHMNIDTFYTDAEGMLMLPQPLVYGKYELLEVQSPHGYVLDETPVPFEVSGEETVVFVEKYNQAQQGKIKIEKTGEQFLSVVENEGWYQPVYEVQGLEDVEFEILAAEDIYTKDGTLRLARGASAASLVTDKEGKAETELLYLGKYLIVEKSTPHGMLLPEGSIEVELQYAGQEADIAETARSIYNERQRAAITLQKNWETDSAFGMDGEGIFQEISFALCAAEEITAADGTVIPEDGILETITIDENGSGQFVTDLPFGSYYVQEISTDPAYQPREEKYPVTFEYDAEGEAYALLEINQGNAIENELKRGEVAGRKIDEEGEGLSGAVIGLFSADEETFEEEQAILTVTTEEDGSFAFADIPYGNWRIKELEAPQGYLMSDEIYDITIGEHEEVIAIEIINRLIKGTVQIRKVNAEDIEMLLGGAEFTIYNDWDGNGLLDEEDQELGLMEEVTEGIYEYSDLPYGTYLVKETKAPGGYEGDVSFYTFRIEEENAIVCVENEAGQGFVNTPLPEIETETETETPGPEETQVPGTYEKGSPGTGDGSFALIVKGLILFGISGILFVVLLSRKKKV